MDSLNKDFLELLNEVIPSEEIDNFVRSIDNSVQTFVRFNTYKPTKNHFEGNDIRWCGNGVALKERGSFTFDPLFHAGAYYVQEASSMFIEQLFIRKILPNVGLAPKVLDLCAAPGGKSTHISSLIGSDALLVANEVIRSRANILKENIIKWGAGNSVVTNNDPSHFSALGGFFDVVMVDTPCSGEGMFRKNVKARGEWSLSGVELCAKRSRRIVADAWSTLKPEGYLIYSTCTFNRRENEEIIDWIVNEFDAEIITPDITDYDDVIVGESGYRFHPNKVDSEGYFVALIRKCGGRDYKGKGGTLNKDKKIRVEEWVSNSDNFIAINDSDRVYAVRKEWLSSIQQIKQYLNVLYFETELGELFGTKLKPSHALALSQYLNRDIHKVRNLTREEVINYLRRDAIAVGDLIEGYNIIGYNDMAVGWAKRVGGRVNNLYPKESRILSRVNICE